MNLIKLHRVPSLFLFALVFFGLRALYYYANGQVIASAHLDAHYFAPHFNILVASVIIIILLWKLLIKKKRRLLKWFSIPAVIVVFAPVHRYIGSLFYCCPCCCTVRHVHQWNVVIAATVPTILLIAFLIKRYIRKSRHLPKQNA